MTTHTTILSLPVLNVLNADGLHLPGESLAPTRGPIRRVGDPYPAHASAGSLNRA